jgi:hypothetical protein
MENTDDLISLSNLAKNLQILETLPIVKQNISFSQKLADLKEKLENKIFKEKSFLKLKNMFETK